MSPPLLVTGGAGFIGSYFVRQQLASGPYHIINLDALTYAGNLQSLPDHHPKHQFVQGNIGDSQLVRSLLNEHQPEGIIHFAAESHVDRSIEGPAAFVQTNVVGTFCLLQAALEYFQGLTKPLQRKFRFLHVSTDEVYGSLGESGKFTETTAYAPNSPYSASKAASDMFARAYYKTYGLPLIITHCSNNYGPYQFPEKLIPLTILHAIEGKPIPVYGDGQNVRDWLYVGDHCMALKTILERGTVGETYNIGGDSERTNLIVVQSICDLIDQLVKPAHAPCRQLIRFVTDRPGHDRRYAIDANKIQRELGWQPIQSFESGIQETVQWYLNNSEWVKNVQSGQYRQECKPHQSGSQSEA